MGGATAVALESAYLMRARGMPVTMLAGDAGVNPALSAAGADIVGLGGARLRAASRARAFLGGLYNRPAHDMIARWIAEHDTPGTVYHLHGWSQILSPSAFRALRGVRERLVVSAHDYFLACPNGSFSFLRTGRVCPHDPLSLSCITAPCDRRNHAEKLWRVARQVIQRHYQQPEGSPPVLAVHQAMGPFLQRGGIPAEAIVTLPNPVRAWCGHKVAAQDNRDLLFVGRVEATKGPDLALAAARAAGVTLRVIGDGAMRCELERRYPEMIFTGALSHGEIAAHAEKARLLIMPSRYPEPYGLVAVEAMWSGLPVILPPTACLAPDIVAAGAGMIVDPADTAAMAAMITDLARDDARVAAMSDAAYGGTASLGLSPQAWSDSLAAIYAERV
jgi:glycosyltransferase involved in cell wall biosynthesis